MKGIIVGTIVTEDVLPLALVLMESFRRHNPDIPFHVLLASDLPVSLTGEHRGLKLLRSADLGFASLQQMFPGYDRKQTVVALKPFLLEHLLKASGGSAVFLDADILVTASLTPLFQQVAQHSLSVTPHISRTKSTPERRDLEHVLLLVGMYNAGFVGVSDREETWRFLDWWKRRLTTHCRNSIREGFHYDQRWLDLAPGLVADLHFVRDPGCNAAHWNLLDLEFERRGQEFYVNSVPLRFFHFSGFDPSRPDEVSRHMPGRKIHEFGAAAELFSQYKLLLDQAGWVKPTSAQWSWGRRLAEFWQSVRTSLSMWH